MARRKQPSIPDQLLDQLLAGADPKSAFAKDGLLDELKKALAERALNAEMDHHLESGEPDGRPNTRNGYGRKTALTDLFFVNRTTIPWPPEPLRMVAGAAIHGYMYLEDGATRRQVAQNAGGAGSGQVVRAPVG